AGRAAVIVPEGIIFQSAKAYTQLRKMLVEKYLYAVVSLPAGVFNPYSGVKTSILFMDRKIAAKANGILFVKVENDGYDLGAQRRAIEKNDLPTATEILSEYRMEVFSRLRYPSMLFQKMMDRYGALIVPKEKLAENGEYNLTGERYRVVERREKQKWPMVRLGDVCEINPESSDPKALYGKTSIIYIDISSVENGTGNVSFSNIISTAASPSRARRVVKNNDILVSTVRPNLKAFAILHDIPAKCIASTGFAVLRCKKTIIPAYLYITIFSDFIVEQMTAKMGKGSYPSVNTSDIENISMNLPPLEVQQEIVTEIEGYQKIIDGCRQVVDNWKPQIDVDPEWPVVRLGEIGELKYGFTASAQENGQARFIRITDISDVGQLIETDPKFVDISDDNKEYLLKTGDLLVARTGATYGKTLLFSEKLKAIYASYLIRIRFKNKSVLPEYYWAFSQSDTYWDQAKKLMTGGGQPQFNGNALKEIYFPCPSLAIQQEIAAKIETERKIVDGCRELIVKYEEKIKKVVNGVWGK
ncbi:MAG: restriction endonuclease subunit S, partial [Treponema sp.]|nr:restriction endonuclease subunit S [Treponema sp.]